jgi:hypothetical protein
LGVERFLGWGKCFVELMKVKKAKKALECEQVLVYKNFMDVFLNKINFFFLKSVQNFSLCDLR